MSLILSSGAETPRGSVTLTVDLSNLDFCKTEKEIEQFFRAALLLQCQIVKLKQDLEVIRNPSPVPVQDMIGCDPIEVAS